MPQMNDIPYPNTKQRKIVAAKQEDEDEGWGDAGALLD